jgi:hypothetical protein
MDRLYYLEVTTPAGTLQSDLLSTTWILEENYLEYVDILIPDGPSGLLGFRILWAQQQVIPWGNNSFLTPNNEKIHVPVNDGITISGLVIESYNTDVFPHTINLRGLIKTLTPEQQQQITTLTGSVALPGSQVQQIGQSSIDTLTAPFIATDDESDENGDTAGSGISGIDNSTDMNDSTEPLAEISETVPALGDISIPSSMPSSITLTSPTTVSIANAPEPAPIIPVVQIVPPKILPNVVT